MRLVVTINLIHSFIDIARNWNTGQHAFAPLSLTYFCIPYIQMPKCSIILLQYLMERVEYIMITIIIIYYSHHKRACAIMFHYILNLMYLSLSHQLNINIYIPTNVEIYSHPYMYKSLENLRTEPNNAQTRAHAVRSKQFTYCAFVSCAYNERRSRVSKCFIKAPFHRVEPLLIA